MTGARGRVRDGVRRRTLLSGVAGAGIAGLAGCTGGSDDPETTAADDGGTTTDAPETTTAATTESGNDDTIKIGLPVPLSGDLAFFGENIVPAARYVIDGINDAGGIDGRNLEPVVGDTELDPDTAVSLVQKMVNVDGVTGMIGPSAGTLFEILDTTQANSVPHFAATSSGDLVPIGGETVFMPYPSDLLAGSAVGTAAANESYNGEQSYERMGVLMAQDGLYSTFLDTLRSSFEDNGGEITEIVEFAGGKSSYQPEADSVVGTDPDVIAILASPTDVVKLMRAAFNAGYEGQWIGTEDISTAEFLSTAPEELTDGMLTVRSTSPSYVDTSTTDRLSEELQQYSEREYGTGAWLSYDSMTVLGLAMKQLEVEGSEITRANVASKIKGVGNPPGTTVMNYADGAAAIENGEDVDFQGIRSNCNFTEKGNVSSPYNVYQVQDGEWAVVEQIPADDLSTE